MKTINIATGCSICAALLLIAGCSSVDPRQVDVQIESGTPMVKTTELETALKRLGKMSEIYGESANLMVAKIDDKTGSAAFSKAEIPVDVTEMTETALNSIGGNIVFIPYNAEMLGFLEGAGYRSSGKMLASAVIKGGITEFDRGLESKEASTNLGYETNEFGEKSPVGIEYQQGEKKSLASITVDYNMIDIATMSGLSRVQTTNTMQVHKGLAQKELGLTIFGPTLGLKGIVKKVEGRHAALRLLVQASMIQIVGKYLDLPYWRLLPGAAPDQVVEDNVSRGWNHQMDRIAQIAKIQELLVLHGYNDVMPTGQIDPKTTSAITQFAEKMKCSKSIDYDLYKVLYYNVPIDEGALKRRYALVEIQAKAKQNAAQAQQQQEVANPPSAINKQSATANPQVPKQNDADALDRLLDKLYR